MRSCIWDSQVSEASLIGQSPRVYLKEAVNMLMRSNF